MKNTIRVRNNSGKNPNSTQVQRDEAREQKEWDDKIKAEFAIPPGADVHPSCLAIVCRDDLGPVSKIPLSEKEFCDVLDIAVKSYVGAEDFVASAIRQKLADHQVPVNELSTAVLQSNALMQLLSDKFDHLAHRDGSVFDGKYAEEMVAGIGILAQHAQEELSKASESVFSAIHPKTTNGVL